MAALDRQELLQTWQGLQGLIKGLPTDRVPAAPVESLSDEALKARIDSQLTSIDHDASLGREPAVDPNGPVPDLSQPQQTAAGARGYAINTIKGALATPSQADMGRFHALVTAYADGHDLTIPDLANDGTITDSERAAAEQIVRRLQAGENAPDIRAAFGTQAVTLAEQKRAAEAAEKARLDAEAAATRQQGNLEAAVDAHLAASGYIKPEQIGKLTDNQRANWLTQFMKDNQFEIGYDNLGKQQDEAINASDAKIKPAALKVLAAGRRGDHRGEDVKTWLENGVRYNDPAQIMMAQATIGVQVTGTVDAVTHATAEAYVKAPYADALTDMPGLVNLTGTVNPSLVWDAANEGRLYMPTAGELRAAGIDEATLASIEAAPSAADLLPKRALLNDKPAENFTEADQAVWVSDTREELIANVYIANPALYEKIIDARNEIAADATLSVAAPINVATPAKDLPVTDIVPEDAGVLEERAAANNPIGSQAVDENIVGGESLMVGSTLHNNADAQTPDGLLVNDGPDSALNNFVLMITPADGTLTMDEALRAAHYINMTEQQAFLGAASGTLNAPTPQDAENIAKQFDVYGDTELSFNDPEQLKILLSGVVAYANRTSIPDGEGNYVQRFLNSDDPSIVAFRDSIDRVANGNPILTKEEPAVKPPEDNNDSTTPIEIPDEAQVSQLNGQAIQPGFFYAPASGKTPITTGLDDGFRNAVNPAEIEEQTRVAGIATPRVSSGLHIG